MCVAGQQLSVSQNSSLSNDSSELFALVLVVVAVTPQDNLIVNRNTRYEGSSPQAHRNKFI